MTAAIEVVEDGEATPAAESDGTNEDARQGRFAVATWYLGRLPGPTSRTQFVWNWANPIPIASATDHSVCRAH